VIDDIANGFIAGLLGQSAAKWATRYKYWLVFLGTFSITLSIFLVILLKGAWEIGFERLWANIVSQPLVPLVFPAVALGAGLIAVFLVYLQNHRTQAVPVRKPE